MRPEADLQRKAAVLAWRYHGLAGEQLLRLLITRDFPGRIALLSSFGAEAAVLLHMVAAVDPTTPVIFLDTGKLFPETLAYRDDLVLRLGLRDVRVLVPHPADLRRRDAAGELWQLDPGACCHLRKVEPLARGLLGFDAVISGRKRYHGGARTELSAITAADGMIKIDPLASYAKERIDSEFIQRKLPRHPLEALGYPSIGCEPCTDRVGHGEEWRAGRWRGREKTECGIHEFRRSIVVS